MKKILPALLLIAAFALIGSFAYRIYANSSIQAHTSIIETPMYEGALEIQQLRAADEKFVQNVVKTTGDPTKSAEICCGKGWAFMEKGDNVSAMKRFNQAWLLDPNYEGSYRGFGALLDIQKDINGSVKMLEKAYAINDHSAQIATDLGHYLVIRGQQASLSNPAGSSEDFRRAEDLFQRAATQDPRFEHAYAEWAVVLFDEGDYVNAWNKVHTARSLGAQSLKGTFVEDLRSRMQDPDRVQ